MPTKRWVLAIDWDAQQLRLVEASMRRQKVHVREMQVADIPPDTDMSNPEAVGAVLRLALDQLEIRTKHVILDVPRDQALLTTLNLPAASPDEMPALVEFQIAKELPFPLAEAVVDFAMPDLEGASGKVDVLVATVRREVVRFYERTCAAAGLTLDRLGLRPYANKVAVGEFLGREHAGCTMIVDVGPRLTEIDIIADGNLAFSRAASVLIGPMTPLGADTVGGDEVREPGEGEGSSIIRFPNSDEGHDPVDRVVESLLVEVTRSLAAFRAQTEGRELDNVVVGGSVGIEARLAEALGRKLRTSVELYHPGDQFQWRKEPGPDVRAFSAALGLVMGHGDRGSLHFDFLHPKKTVTTVERRLRKAPLVAAAVALFVIAGVGFYMKTIAPKQREIAELEARIKDVKSAIKDLKEYRERVIEPVKQFEDEQVVWLDELARLVELMPDNKNAVLTRLDMYQKGARMIIPLKCKSSDVASETVSRIDAFTLPGSDALHFNASAKRFSTESGGYPSVGSIEVVLEGKKGT
ncbi:MAG: pilus assembly protein PilM [Phycisphaerales bacterium]|nr:pilus assembly protein PilM [Phycisphaerales bacterium]